MLSRSASRPATEVRVSHLSLSLKPIVRDWLAAPWSFKLTCLYVFFEYVRPQQIYNWLAGPRWALMCLVGASVAYVFEGLRLRSRTAINSLLFLFTVILVASSIAAEFQYASFGEFTIFANWIIAFFLIANTATTERRFFLFTVLFLLWSAKMSQHGFRTWAMRGFSFAGFGVVGSPGWFANSGEFALQMTIFLPLVIYFLVALYPHLSKIKIMILVFLPVTAVGSIAASSSRGGQLALAILGLWFLARSKRRVRAFALLAVTAPIVWISIPQKQKDRFRESGTDKTSVLRIQYWKAGVAMANEYPILGIGYENWSEYYSKRYFSPSDSLVVYDKLGKPVVETSHNSFVEVGSQLGYLGLAAFLLLISSTWWVNAQSRRLLLPLGERGRFLRNMSYGLDGGMIGFVVAGFFMAVAFYPMVWFQLAMTAALNTAVKSLLQVRLSDTVRYGSRQSHHVGRAVSFAGR